MSMSSYVEGIIPADEPWKKMKAVWDACHIARVKPPDEVKKFFHGEPPDPKGVILSSTELNNAVQPWSNPSSAQDGFEVDINKLPPNVSIIRFINSY